MADAAKGYQSAYELLKRIAPGHPEMSQVQYMMAVAMMQQGHYDEALVQFQQVADERVRVFGEGSLLVAEALDGVSVCYQGKDDLARALEARNRSLAVREKALGPDNPDVALSLQGIAYIALDQGNCDEAIRASNRALAIFDKNHSSDKLRIDSLDAIGTCQTRSGKLADARAALEKALALADAPGGGSIDQRTTARVDLGELLWLQTDHARARKLVREALEIYRGAGRTDDVAEQEAWLAKHCALTSPSASRCRRTWCCARGAPAWLSRSRDWLAPSRRAGSFSGTRLRTRSGSSSCRTRPDDAHHRSTA